MSVRVVILARFPVPGQCKTRLIPGLGEEGAADMHRRLAERTVATVRASGLNFEVWGTGGTSESFLSWLGPHTYHEQPRGDLGERLMASAEPYPVIFLGTDCPGIGPQHLEEAADELRDGGTVIGPASDGGYWTLGLSEPCATAFRDMPWGTEKVYALTMERLAAAGMTPTVLEVLDDIDRPEDLEAWPELLS